MANPEQGLSPLTQDTGSWLDFDAALPDFLAPVREAVDNIAQLLIALLNVLLSVLDVIKAFTTGFLDPLIALIEALIALIEDLINDLRNAGFYLHGDWYLIEGPEFRNLLGGFQAYERRMIQRLIDPTDPNRPDISPSSTVIALFFYASADARTLMRLLNFIRGILALFGREGNFRARSLGSVSNLRVRYGIEGATESFIGGTETLFDSMVARQDGTEGIRQIGEPNLATIQWQLADPPGNFVSPVSRLVPDNFIIDVSTEPNPLFLQYDIVPSGKQVVSRDPSSAENSPNRIRGLVVDEQGRTLEVTGGSDQFLIDGESFFFEEDGGSRPRVFAFKNAADSTPIRIDRPLRDSEGRPVLQRRFFFTGPEVGAITPGQFLAATLKLEDMPRRATFKSDGTVDKSEPTDTFYVTVRAVSRQVTENNPFRYEISLPMFSTGRLPIVAKVAQNTGGERLSLLDIGEASRPLKITFPNANTAAYLECVLSALYVMVLTRPDLTQLIDEDGNPKEFDPDDSWNIYGNHVKTLTGLEPVAKKLLPQITGRKSDNSKFYASESSPVKWRRKVFHRCAALVNRLYEDNNPPPSVQGLVVDLCQPLLDFRLGDLVSDFGSQVAAEQQDRGVSTGPGRSPEEQDGPLSLIETKDLEDLSLIEAMQSGDEFGGIAANPFSVGTVDADLQQTKLALRVDINQGKIPEPYTPSFYTTTNDDLILIAQENRARQRARIQEEIDRLSSEGDFLTVENLLTTLELSQRQSSLERFFEATSLPPRVIRGSVTSAPVFYVRRGWRITKLTYCRNAFDAEILNAAATALQIATGPVIDADGGWITARLGQLLPEVDTFLDEILAWIRALAAAIDSIAKAIRRFIEYLQARIIELQMLIQRINAILQNLLRLFDILPAGAILPIVSQGTSGVLTDLVTAQNKPFDGPSFYGGGVVVLASVGPLFPSFFLDIFGGSSS